LKEYYFNISYYFIVYYYMKELTKTIFVIAILILLIDAFMLSSLSSVWKKTIEDVQGKTFKVKIHYAIASYILLIFGQYYFVYKHIPRSNWFNYALLNGFLFGFVTYGVFDFTNLAIFTDYALSTAIIDMIWGGTLMAIVSILSYYILNII
jgi:uncharacterized membrane protein